MVQKQTTLDASNRIKRALFSFALGVHLLLPGNIFCNQFWRRGVEGLMRAGTSASSSDLKNDATGQSALEGQGRR